MHANSSSRGETERRRVKTQVNQRSSTVENTLFTKYSAWVENEGLPTKQPRHDRCPGKCLYSLFCRKDSIFDFTVTVMVTAAFDTRRQGSWLPSPPHCHRPAVVQMTSNVNREERHPFLLNSTSGGHGSLIRRQWYFRLFVMEGKTLERCFKVYLKISK